MVFELFVISRSVVREKPDLLLRVWENNLGQGQNEETGVVSWHKTIYLGYLCSACCVF